MTKKFGMGSHTAARIAAAALAPARPPANPVKGDLHNEGDRWWERGESRWEPATPTEAEKAGHLVTVAAREAGELDDVSVALTKAMQRGLGRRYLVEGRVDYVRMMHILTVTQPPSFMLDRGRFRASGSPVVLEVTEGELSAKTVDVRAFNAFIKELCSRVRPETGTTVVRPETGTTVEPLDSFAGRFGVGSEITVPSQRAEERRKQQESSRMRELVEEEAAINSIISGSSSLGIDAFSRAPRSDR